MKYTYLKYSLVSIPWIIILSCKKQDEFLNKKPDQALIIASTLADYQLLLNNESIFNLNGDPGLGSVTADDDYYIANSDWASATSPERNGYTWSQNFYENDPVYSDWNNPYKQVYYCNNVLEGLPKLQISPQEQSQYNQIKGSALFLRSYAYYNLVQTFALPYDSLTADNDLGVCLRLSTDFNIRFGRASVQQCYAQILEDLQTALELLPATSAYKTQPSKWAANALLARIYLGMRKYSKAFLHADACLIQNNVLTDYNSLNLATFNISNSFLEEDIFHTSMIGYTILTRNRAIIDSNLYNSYNQNDLRKTLFFFPLNGTFRFRGSYEYISSKFTGLATDEIY